MRGAILRTVQGKGSPALQDETDQAVTSPYSRIVSRNFVLLDVADDSKSQVTLPVLVRSSTFNLKNDVMDSR